jgi:hypothetical protein
MLIDSPQRALCVQCHAGDGEHLGVKKVSQAN